ncbi:kelch repeat-containing protein [Chryseolinea lacunae]|uniref:IPT/TIG domain-containing protein n=1 Tax=Chryseolinea lacunae TaxID=2801331 RepID=A0ABS1L534_9BACT|nr:kelch repeat-containing protein [Chryseolinea lacunae]MBL0745671.1 hypothetical protein [Chryseolinea lacunae]
MFKKISVFLFAMLALACSDEDSAPAPLVCESVLASGIGISESYAYTGDTYTIAGTKFCKADLVSVLFNDTEIALTETLETKISFVIPETITSDSVAIKIKTKTSTVDLHKKIAIFPGSGSWITAQAFPGGERAFTQAAVLNGKGYVFGGERFLGYSEGTYPKTKYNDLYEFDPTANSWTLVHADDKFIDKAATVGWNNTLFLFSNLVSGPATTFALDGKVFSETKSYSTAWALNVKGFTLGNDLYTAVTENSTKKIDIRKYNITTKNWDIVQSTDFSATNTFADFAFEYDGMAYLGINALNSSTVELWAYDATENKLTKINTITPVGNSSLISMRHLFTINGLAYFIENGDASIGPDGASVVDPTSNLYIYNLKAKAWRQVSHTFPENFYGIISFGVNGRGFAGISADSGKPSYKYSTKIYEFKAK